MASYNRKRKSKKRFTAEESSYNEVDARPGRYLTLVEARRVFDEPPHFASPTVRSDIVARHFPLEKDLTSWAKLKAFFRRLFNR